MSKLLYLVHRIPYPPNKGDKIRSFHFLKALAEFYDIYLGTFIDDPDDRQYVDALKPFCKQIFCVDLHPKLNKIKSLTGFLNGEALSLPYYRNQAIQDWVDKMIADHGIERVLIFSSPMAQYVEKHTQLHFVADFVDVDSDKWRQYAANKRWPANWIYRREADKLLEFEVRIANRADATLFVSEKEAELFRQWVPAIANKICYVNNGVDTDAFDPEKHYESPFSSGQKNIVFTGAMDYWANVDAVVWFAREVFPLVKQQCAEAKFYIVGSKPDKAVLQLAAVDDAVVVTGRVEDVKNYVAYADAVVAPLRIARGIQNKVLEAMAMARPVVVTPAAMEGISGNDDIQVDVAEESRRFAEKVLDVLNQPFYSVPQNRRYVQTDFSWQQCGRDLFGKLNAVEN
ncbi:MAG: TIGR03087 family PEP-CTERM/XrtA system glycosyltransferase [Gammaproteobacteria bacterium]